MFGVEQFFVENFFQFAGAIILGILSWGFKSWSSSIKKASDDILTELKALTKEFHAYRVEIENRVTRVETKVDEVHYHRSSEK